MMFWRIFRLELRVAFRHSAEIANPLWFFLIVITLFPLSIGPEPQLLARLHRALSGLLRCFHPCWRWNDCSVTICRTAVLNN